MTIYLVTFALIMLNGILCNGKHKKWFVVSSFILVVLLMGLRKYTVGIDLSLHYASNFQLIASTRWSDLDIFVTKVGGYDYGFVFFVKLISYISNNPQIFIFTTSLIIYGSLARFLYIHSENIVMDTYMLFTTFMLFMFMNIIAQALAVAVILFGIDYLSTKKYIRFTLVVLLATSIHASAIFCLLFVFINILGRNKYIFLVYTMGIVATTFIFDKMLDLVVTYIFPSFSFYVTGNVHGSAMNISAFSIYYILIYAIPLVLGYLFIYKKPIDYKNTVAKIVKKRKIMNFVSLTKIRVLKLTEEEFQPMATDFLMYISVTAVILRVLAHLMEVASRPVYYLAPFTIILLGRSIAVIPSRSNRLFISTIVYSFFFLAFLYFFPKVGYANYGVLPYEFFWE